MLQEEPILGFLALGSRDFWSLCPGRKGPAVWDTHEFGKAQGRGTPPWCPMHVISTLAMDVALLVKGYIRNPWT